MQDFDSRIGWTRAGMFLSAILLAVLGILCFVAHGIMPEPLHKPILPDGYTPGGIYAGVVMLVTGVVLCAAYKMAGGSRNLSGFMILTGVFSLFDGVAILADPFCGTLSYEWVVAVLFGLWGFLAFLEGICAGRTIGYKGWGLQVILGLIMILFAVGVLLDSSKASIMAGGAVICGAIEVAVIPVFGKSIKLAK